MNNRIFFGIVLMVFGFSILSHSQSAQPREIRDLLMTLQHGVILYNEYRSEAYRQLDSSEKRWVHSRMTDYLFDSLCPAFTECVDSLSKNFDSSVCFELFNHFIAIKPDGIVAEIYGAGLARLYERRPDGLEKTLLKLDKANQLYVISYIPDDWYDLISSLQRRVDRLKKMTPRLSEFYYKVTKKKMERVSK